MNIEKLDEAIAYIEAHPEQHNQNAWFNRTPCGTAACLAGTVAKLAGWEPLWRGDTATDVVRGSEVKHVAVAASAVLDIGLDDAERSYLFLQAADLDDIKTFREQYVAGTWKPEDW